ncbi:MAG: decaprenyl-phosphate phosphoribosyltransferase [Candidatus Hodarchaeota archaeon]
MEFVQQIHFLAIKLHENGLKQIILSMRPKQWTKNIVLFAALIFSQNLFHGQNFLRVLEAFILFTLLSGGVYIFNDLIDIEKDRYHPKKFQRPLASGKLKPTNAIIAFILIGTAGLVFSFLLNVRFGLVALSYIILQLAYTFSLKHIIILDVFCVAAGFVLRVLAGAVVLDVPVSTWFLVCTMLLALFLSFCKRRHELINLEGEAVNHRKSLKEYNPYLLDQMIAVVTASTLMSYALYTMATETTQKFGTTNLKYTIPLVLFGIFRYLYLIHQKNEGGNPESIILKDKPMILNICIFVLMITVILYW